MFLGQQDVSPATLIAGADDAERDGRFAQARQLWCRAVSQDDTPRSRYGWAAFLTRQGDDAGAAVEWRRLWESLVGTESAGLSVAVSHNLAALHRRRGESLLAAQWQRRATAEEMRRNGAVRDPDLLIALANDALAERRWTNAAAYLRTALRCARMDENDAAAADALGTFGALHQLRGRSFRALRCHREALVIHRAVGDDAGAACDCLNLSGIAVRRGRPKAALSAARLAVAFATRSNDRPLLRRAQDTAREIRGALAKLSRPARWN